MSTTKISDLPVLSTADAADEFVVVDDSAGVTKKITYDSLATDVRTESEALTATTVNASGLVTASAGINFGADTLDDYEEGTWTPTISGGTGSVSYTTQDGVYTKIGRLVIANYALGFDVSTLSSSDVRLSNLPFASTTPSPNLAINAVRINGYTNEPNGYVSLVRSGQTYAIFRTMNADSDANLPSSVLTNNTGLNGILMYYAD